VRTPFVVMAASFALLLPLRSEASSFRCGKRIVSSGSTKAELLLKCGAPFAQDSRVETFEVEVKDRGPDGDSVKATRTVTRVWDEWTYNFGPHQLLQTAVFRDGKLVDVRSGDYGT
jgi:hypothetical protein